MHGKGLRKCRSGIGVPVMQNCISLSAMFGRWWGSHSWTPVSDKSCWYLLPPTLPFISKYTISLTIQGPHLRTPNPGLNPGFTPPPHLLYKKGVKPRVKPGVRRPEIWAQVKQKKNFSTGIYASSRCLYNWKIKCRLKSRLDLQYYKR
jgi:hypothetical protein